MKFERGKFKYNFRRLIEVKPYMYMKHWICDKCGRAYSSYKGLKSHKQVRHAY
jgi:hypothetical protein